MKLLLTIVQFFLVFTHACSTGTDKKTKFFRKDYKYIKEFDAFYKEHRLPQNWSEAVAYCAGEEAQLATPESKAELDAIMVITRKKSEWFWVEIHDIYSEGDFITLNGTSLSDTFINWGSGEPNNENNDEDCVIIGKDGRYNDVSCSSKYLYICKKSALGLKQNDICETYDPDYVYAFETDRCYKFHKIAMKWNKAFRICSSEESQLTIINSIAEAKLLANYFARYPSNVLKENIEKDFIHIGFNDLISPGLYLTVEGKHISDTGYEQWGSGQPDNHDGMEHCGAMDRDGDLHDIQCSIRAMFICEKSLRDNKREGAKLSTELSTFTYIEI